MNRRVFLAGTTALCSFLSNLAAAAATAGDAQHFINNLGDAAISALTGPDLSEEEREKRFRGLLESHFDLPGISKFVLGRYWRVANDTERSDFRRLFENLLVQAYAKRFAEYAGERFQVSTSHPNDDGSVTVNSLIDRPNGDVIHLDWRVENAGQPKIADLIVEGVSLRTTYRSDIASAVQNNGGKVAGLLDALRQKTGTQ
jgi:phospholipid transport system substrate-binding protein